MRRNIKDQRLRDVPEFFERRPPLAGLVGQKPEKEKRVYGKPGKQKGRNECGRSGKDVDRDSGPYRLRNDTRPRVGDSGGACVRHERDVFAGEEPAKK